TPARFTALPNRSWSPQPLLRPRDTSRKQRFRAAQYTPKCTKTHPIAPELTRFRPMLSFFFTETGSNSHGADTVDHPMDRRINARYLFDALSLVPRPRPVHRRLAQVVGDAQELVVLRVAVGAAGGAGLDLPAVGR